MTQRYDTYKDSGVQWLGEIPGHWECVRLNKLAYLRTGSTPKFFENKLFDETIDWYTPSDFNEDFSLGKARRRLNRKDFEDCGLNYIPANSVLLIGIGATAGKVSCNTRECYSNQQITSIIPNNRMISFYMMLYLRSIRNIILKTAHYTTLPILNNLFLAGISLPLPPLSEQRSIVSYLDAKCGKIDEWVTKKQKEVEHLQELKQRVIADAVTRGLNPHVKMKATNIPWIKEIPEHWEMRKMKYLFDERSEKNHPNEPMLSATQSEGVILQSKYQGRVVVVNTGFEGLKLVKVGDFVIHLRSFQGGIEYAHYRGIISSAYTILNPKYPEYSAYYKRLFKSSSFIDLLKICVTGIREGQNINYSKLKQFSIPVPPLSEQKQIVSYLDTKCAKIDKLITNITKEIDCIKEYKQRLISDVVTGQIKVC